MLFTWKTNETFVCSRLFKSFIPEVLRQLMEASFYFDRHITLRGDQKGHAIWIL